MSNDGEEQRDKPRLLALMNTGYTEFTTLIAPLDATQLTTPGVDHQWSIKDILVHLGFWQHHLLTYLQAAIQGETPEEMTHEEIDICDDNTPVPMMHWRRASRNPHQLMTFQT